MNHRPIIPLVIAMACMLYSITATAVSSQKKTLLLKPSHAQVDSILSVLDDAILHQSEYQARRIAHADSLVKAASAMQGQERIEALKDAFKSFSHVSGQKSMDILDSIEALPEYQGDRDLRLWVLDSRGYIYSVMGMFHRSYALLHEVQPDTYDRPARMYHYDTMYKVLTWADNAFCNEASLLPQEKADMKMFNDSLLSYNNDAMSYAFAEVAHDIDGEDYDNALKKLIELYQNTTGQEETYVYAHLCDVFVGKKDTLALTYYFAKTSISDIKDGTTEYMCLPILVHYLFNNGDVDRAYNYLKCCLEDAYLYPSQFLITQTTNIFPIVDKQYQIKKEEYEETRHNMMIVGFFAILFFLALIALSVFLHHRQQMMTELQTANDRLAVTNNDLAQANNDLAQANKDLAQANNVKDIFLQNMTHELHTPMNAIDGFAQLLNESDGQIDDDSRKEMITAIRSSSHQLNMLIDNIIMLTEYENTNVETKKSPVYVSNIFASLKQQVYNPKPKLVDIIYDNSIPEGYMFMSSGVHLFTILNYLIDNALKFTEVGNVTVTAHLDKDSKESKESNVVFRVADTGVGIPKDRIDTLFERFSAVGEFAQGVSLSLPLCHTLTTLIGGQIRIDKTDSNGTTISVTIPTL